MLAAHFYCHQAMGIPIDTIVEVESGSGTSFNNKSRVNCNYPL